MLIRDKVIGLIIIANFVVAGVVLAYNRWKAEQPVPLPYRAVDVIDYNLPFRGDLSSKITLVEFGDYQCPPCAAVYPKVEHLLKNRRGLRFQFHALPLTNLHSLAWRAGLIAASAEIHGDFWKVHDKLFSFNAHLSPVLLDHFSIFNKNQAIKLLTREVQEDRKLKINATPTFLLCLPDNSVFLISSFKQIETYLH